MNMQTPFLVVICTMYYFNGLAVSMKLDAFVVKLKLTYFETC